MQEQMPLNFEAPKVPPYEHMSIEELKSVYKEKIGVSTRIGRDEKGHLIWAIQNPAEELAEIQKIDSADDKDDLSGPYTRKN